jgi:hypothetical protein
MCAGALYSGEAFGFAHDGAFRRRGGGGAAASPATMGEALAPAG